jgi:menaquinone-dependent protoporphyrinogen oxidase
MARILVVYGTTEGHTAKVAGAISETLHRTGAVVDVHAADDPAPAPDDYDAVVVAASVHAGHYQRSVRRWAKAHAAVLSRKPAAFVSVCLGVMQHDAKVERDLQAILERFAAETGWRPAVAKVVAGALPYTRYGWLQRVIMKRIVAKAGGDTDTRRDFEYTDWNDLRHFAADFSSMVPAGRPPGAPYPLEPNPPSPK